MPRKLREPLQPFFSIIIPTYNRLESLWRALQSLTLQTIPRSYFEVIVVNNFPDVSIDNNVKRTANKINIISIDEPEKGAHNARNLASSLARGEYLVLLDDDCEACPTFLEAYYQAISCYNPVIGGGKIEIKWDSPPPHWVTGFEHLMGHIDYGSNTCMLQQGLTVNGGNMFIRRNFFEEIGGMEPDQVGKIILGAGDTALNLTANNLGHTILWVGSAKVFHHQKKDVNAKVRDLLRREFNNGIMIAYEALTRHRTAPGKRMAKISGRLLAMSLRQFSQAITSFQQHAFLASIFTFSRIMGAHWFYFFKKNEI